MAAVIPAITCRQIGCDRRNTLELLCDKVDTDAVVTRLVKLTRQRLARKILQPSAHQDNQ